MSEFYRPPLPFHNAQGLERWECGEGFKVLPSGATPPSAGAPPTATAQLASTASALAASTAPPASTRRLLAIQPAARTAQLRTTAAPREIPMSTVRVSVTPEPPALPTPTHRKPGHHGEDPRGQCEPRLPALDTTAVRAPSLPPHPLGQYLWRLQCSASGAHTHTAHPKVLIIVQLRFTPIFFSLVSPQATHSDAF